MTFTVITKTGEKVTQVQHAQQAAEQARKEGHPPQVFYIFFSSYLSVVTLLMFFKYFFLHIYL